jgi:hypothetical protein
MARVPLPPNGLVISQKLADVLQARLGDAVAVEVMEASGQSSRRRSPD